MKVQEFLEHHGVSRNPFAEEDAQTDPVFKEHCIASTFHPSWDKIYGDPRDPATAVVFGEKGAGKTAIQLQIAAHLTEHNKSHPRERSFVVRYSDFNHFLDRFRDRLPSRSRKNVERVLSQWMLWDHMDAVLTLAVTDLVDEILGLETQKPPGPNAVGHDQLAALSRSEARDLLLLAACYDQSTSGTFRGRWQRLRQTLKFKTWVAQLDLLFACTWTLLVAGAATAAYVGEYLVSWHWLWLALALIVAGWLPRCWRWWRCFRAARGVVRNVRVGNREGAPLRQVLLRFRKAELAGQPLPVARRTDDRYELMTKLQTVLKRLGFSGMTVLVDRLDEPHLINGSPELMKALLWPMLDNKFLKHPGMGLKLTLPIELRPFIEREDRAFHERARLDKQNMVSAFEWSGEALYDMANARLKACAEPGQDVSLSDLFDPAVSQQRLIDSFRQLRVPRRLFKFLYRLLSAHCSAHTSQQPSWKIPPELFEATLAVFLRDQDAYDRGVGTG